MRLLIENHSDGDKSPVLGETCGQWCDDYGMKNMTTPRPAPPPSHVAIHHLPKVVKEYMQEDRVFIDLVKEGSVKASKDVAHIGIPCHWTRCENVFCLSGFFSSTEYWYMYVRRIVLFD